MATMKKPKYPNGLREAMERASKGPTELAERLDTNKQNITRWSNGDRKLTVDWAKKLAPLLDTTADVLLLVSEAGSSPERPSKGQKRLISVPLLDTVTAGKLKAPSSQIPVEDVPLLAFADLGRGDWFALKVESDADSMDRVSPPGSMLLINKADRDLRSGRCYIFSIDGETTYKMWQDGDPAYLAPFSTNPTHKPIFIRRRRAFDVIGRVKRTVLDL
jgi:SOS-response transcriptional repressor LexA